MERFAGVLALLCAAGCFEPGIRDAQISCEANDLCPSGFVCLDGLCRNQAPEDDNKGDDLGPDGGSDQLPDPDGGDQPAFGPKVYELSGQTWSATMATAYFSGSGLNSAGVVTAWSHCDGGDVQRCFGDADNIACHDGTSWASAGWDEIDNNLTSFNATFSTAYLINGDTWAFDTHRGEDWRGYEGPALSRNGNQLRSQLDRVIVSGQNGVPDLNQIYGNDEGAPDTFDDIVADYLNVGESGDPWSFLSANGDRFTIRNNTNNTTGDKEPSLMLPGAPLSTDIRAALMGQGKLLFVADN